MCHTLREYIFKTKYGLIKNSVERILIQEIFQQIHYFHRSPKKILHGCFAYFIRRAKKHLKWHCWYLYCASFYQERLLLNIESNWFLLSLLSVIEWWFTPEAVSSSQIIKEHSWEKRDKERIRENEQKNAKINLVFQR